MKAVFADSVYWIARALPNDQWHLAATKARDALGGILIVTTDEVLSEFLTLLGKCGPEVRGTAVKMVKAILGKPDVRVLPQTRDGFLKGLEMYAARPDKGYSLTDCISMNAMKENQIHQVLTCDHHFEQEGFEILMK